jgi:diaminopimelate decarboxylase
LNIDVSTGGELALALAGGISPSRIGLHGNNKSLYEIGKAVTAGVGAIVIDSEIEIERIASIAGAQDKVQNVRIRVNSGVHAYTHEYLATSREDQERFP